jgi:hypothetical protein
LRLCVILVFDLHNLADHNVQNDEAHYLTRLLNSRFLLAGAAASNNHETLWKGILVQPLCLYLREHVPRFAQHIGEDVLS